MAAECVFVRKDGEGSKPTMFFSNADLNFVARHFNDGRSSGSVAAKTTAEGGVFFALPLDTKLHQLRCLSNLEGNGSGAAPYIVRLKQTGVAQLPEAPAEVLASFMSKLKVFRVNNPPDHIITRLITHYGSALTLAASKIAPPEAALDLYRAAQLMPGTQTLCAIATELKLAINGPLRKTEPYIVSAIDLDTGKPKVVKVLVTHEVFYQRASQAELSAVDLLRLNFPEAPLVKTQVLDYHVSATDAGLLGVGSGPRKLLVMPWFVSDLANLPQLSCSLIAQAAVRMEQALDFMHDLNLAHMDVKPRNILMDHEGQCFLGDFGASLLFGEKVPRDIKTVYPGVLPTEASAVIDWRLLVVTIAILLDKKNLDVVTVSGTPVPAAVKTRCNFHCQQSSELEQVMERLFIKAEWAQL